MNDKMHTVAIHVRDKDSGQFGGGDYRVMSRIPSVDEYVCLGTTEPWHKVLAVVHCAFDAGCVAEVYVSWGVDPAGVRRAAGDTTDRKRQTGVVA